MKFIIADDHGLFRDSMAVWLKQLDEAIDIAFATSFEEADRLASDANIDLIMLDLGMPGMQGAYSVRKLCQHGIPVVVVSADENPLTIRSCLEAGARGYVTKSSEGEIILDAVKQVLAGGNYIPRTALHQFTEHPDFSKKQMQLLACLAEGMSNRDIAQQMSLTEGTVKQYVSRMLRLLGVDNRIQAGLKARELLGIGSS